MRAGAEGTCLFVLILYTWLPGVCINELLIS